MGTTSQKMIIGVRVEVEEFSYFLFQTSQQPYLDLLAMVILTPRFLHESFQAGSFL